MVPEGRFVDIGPEKTGVVLHDGYAQGGYAWGWDIIIADVNEHLQVVAMIETNAANVGNCPDHEPCWEYSSRYEMISGNNPVFYDIRVHTSGTKMVDGEVAPVEETSLLVFADSEYRSTDE
jgi:hypothetical protein